MAISSFVGKNVESKAVTLLFHSFEGEDLFSGPPGDHSDRQDVSLLLCFYLTCSTRKLSQNIPDVAELECLRRQLVLSKSNSMLL